MPGRELAHAGRRRAVDWLGRATWVVVLGGFPVNLAITGGSGGEIQLVHVLTLGVFFLLVLGRLLLAATVSRRKAALLILSGGIALWAAGSVVLNASAQPDLTRFPAPGEWLFLASYLAIAGYLILDEAHWQQSTPGAWLDAVVVCGGTTCMAGALLLTPLGSSAGNGGVSLLLALLYPMIDTALALLVIGQVMLRVRPSGRKSLALCAGLLLFAVADLNFVTHLSVGTYEFNVLDGLAWAAGFALLAEAACLPRSTGARALPRRAGPGLMILAAFVATGILAAHPQTRLGTYLTVPAVLTLVAAGGRLVLALRDANGAAEAFALSRTDDLTLLPNRRSVYARLDEAMLAAGPLGLMLLDLDGFKEVNDTLGHAAGDSVLQLVAHRVRQALPSSVMVGRLGGDEYAIVMNSQDPLLLLETANLVLDVVRQPTLVDGIELSTSASIGITARTAQDTKSTELLRRADVAMYQAKATRAGALIYDAHSDDFSRQRLRMAEELRRAITEGQLVMYYQPQLDAATMGVCGLEALVRWQHPQQGLLSPLAFLPAARRDGLMLGLSEAVTRLVIADLRRWRANGLNPRVSLNCAPPELLSGVFLPRLYEMLADARLAAECLVIEVTEDTFIAEPERARAVLTDMRAHRLQIAIDDYGTGFSSLSYLRDLPVQELKVDRSFVAAITTDQRTRMIVSSTFQLAKALGLRTVAEGVENAATAAEVIALGVDVLQGYHVARPMPFAEVEPWVRERTVLSERRFA